MGINITGVHEPIQITVGNICESVICSQAEWKVLRDKLSPGYIVGTNWNIFLIHTILIYSSEGLKENTNMYQGPITCQILS